MILVPRNVRSLELASAIECSAHNSKSECEALWEPIKGVLQRAKGRLPKRSAIDTET